MDTFYSEKHQKLIKRLERHMKALEPLIKMAKKYGIDDITQDNGLKVLQQLIYLNFDFLPGREGNDSVSASGIEWEMKSANEAKVQGFSTNHHTNFEIIEKYRQVPWSFAIYENLTLKEIYVMRPKQLEQFFKKWEDELTAEVQKGNLTPHKNNPKIPIAFVRGNGIQVFPINPNAPVDPDSINS